MGCGASTAYKAGPSTVGITTASSEAASVPATGEHEVVDHTAANHEVVNVDNAKPIALTGSLNQSDSSGGQKGPAVTGNRRRSKVEIDAITATASTILREVPKAFHEGMIVYYRDIFVSQAKAAAGVERSISVWRESEIKHLDRATGKAKLQFTASNNKQGTREVDLLVEWPNIAHTELAMPRKQRLKGQPLTDEQLMKSYYLLHTGKHLTMSKSEAISAAAISTAADTAIASQIEPVNAVPSHNYKIGQELDIQDVFVTKRTEEIKCKWRKAEIVDVSGNLIRIHYVGWEDKWDEVLDVAVDKHRIREIGSMTSLQRKSSLESSQFAALADLTSSKEKDKLGGGLLSPSNSSAGANSHGRRGSLGRRRSLNGTPDAESRSYALSSGDQAVFDRWMNLDSPVTPMTSKHQQPLTSTPESGLELSSSRRRSSVVVPKGLLQKHHSLKDLEVAKSELAFEDRMEQAGMFIVEVEGDGNCLFRAVAHQLYMDESRHDELRQRCVEHMAAHQKRFALFCSAPINEHLKRMSASGTWADDMEIRALEEILDRVFFIYSPPCSKEMVPIPMNINFSEAALLGNDHAIKLSYHGNNHYNSVFDQKIGLPLESLPSKRILNNRLKLFAQKKR